MVILGKHAHDKCKHWFPKEKVINDGILLHGSQIGNNCISQECQRDSILPMMKRAGAFLSGVELNPLLDSSKRDEYLFFYSYGQWKKRNKLNPEHELQCKLQRQLRDKA